MMTKKQAIITYSYHFLSEALITFLAIIPILHMYSADVPYVSFLFMAISLTLFFAMITRWTTHYGPYLLSVPVMFGAFYLFNFHWVISAIIAIFLVWRYISLRLDENPRKEPVYLRWALVLSIISALIVNDPKLVAYLAFVFAVLIVGYIARHLTALEQSKEHSFNHLYWIYLGIGMLLGVGLIYVLFPTVRLLIGTIWQGFTYGIIFLGSQVVRLLTQFKFFDGDFFQEGESHEELGEASDYHDEALEVGDSFMFEWIGQALLWLIGATIVGFLLWRAYKMFKRRFTTTELSDSAATVTHESMESTRGKDGNFITRMMERFRRAPNHPIRKLVYDIERKVSGTKYERKTYETVEDWLDRLQIQANFNVYQAVRYGNVEVTTSEIDELKDEIQQIEQLLDED